MSAAKTEYVNGNRELLLMSDVQCVGYYVCHLSLKVSLLINFSLLPEPIVIELTANKINCENHNE